jgi:hypothetical protein
MAIKVIYEKEVVSDDGTYFEECEQEDATHIHFCGNEDNLPCRREKIQ